MGQKSIIDQTAFERLLFWLNPNRDKAAEKYEKVILQYVAGNKKRRQEQAQRLGITLNTLENSHISKSKRLFGHVLRTVAKRTHREIICLNLSYRSRVRKTGTEECRRMS